MEAVADAGRKYKQLGDTSSAFDEIERRHRSFGEARKIARNLKLAPISEALLVKIALNKDASIDPTMVSGVLALLDHLETALPRKGKTIDKLDSDPDFEELTLRAIYPHYDD